jgi:membrane protease YdiL (CAAX protease family)
MPDHQPPPDPALELQSGSTPETGAQPPIEPSPAARAWGRSDRNRLLIWVGITFILPLPFLFLLPGGIKPSGSVFTIQGILPGKALTAFFAVLATWIVARMEKRPFSDYGVPPRQALGLRLWEGFTWGFAMLSVIVMTLRLSGHFQIDSVELAGGALIRYALGWAAVFLCVGISEEFAFRGYWLFSFAKRFRFWPAAFFTSLIFGVAHLGNPGENAFGILQVVAIGLLFCLMIRRTGTLWFAVGFHAAWDWAETFFWGTPDSGLVGVGRFLNTSVHGPNWLTGGSAGPEGSVLALGVIGLCALLVHIRFPSSTYPDRPQ